MKEVIGFDTETSPDGYCRLLACSNNTHVIPEKPEDILDFLYKNYGFSIQVFYNLDFDVAAMMKWLGPEACKDLIEKEVITYGDYEITYWPSKLFKVQKGKYKNIFYDINNFISEKLETAAPKYLKEEKIPSEIKPEVCIQHAKLAAKLGQKIISCLMDMGIETNSLISPVSIMKKHYIDQLDIPTHSDLPEEVAQMAYDCCDGEWTEAFKIGYFPKLHSYDLSGAYPSELFWLPDFRLGKWVQSDKPVQGSRLAYLSGNVEIEKDYSPVVFRDDYNYEAMGMWERAITGRTWAFLKEFQIGNFEIKDSWWWTPEKKVYPFQKMVTEMFKFKKKGGLIGHLSKLMMAGMWGLFGQVYENPDGDELGEYFNSVYVAEVTNNVKLKVARAIHVNNLNPVHVAVDQILLEEECQAIVGNGGLGEWRYDGTTQAIIIGSQILALEGQKYLGIDFEAFKNLITASPDYRKYHFGWNIPSLLRKGQGFEDLGQFKTVQWDIDIQYECKRNFPVKPKTGKDLMAGQFTSLPWDITAVRGCGSGREKHYEDED